MKLTKSEAGQLGAAASRLVVAANYKNRVARYTATPKLCMGCGVALDYSKRHNDFCSQSCGAVFCNNRRYSTNERKHGYLKDCKTCGIKLNPSQTKFCSRICEHEHRYSTYIAAWKSGAVSGYSEKNGKISGFVRRYLLKVRGERCEKCGWCERNQVTGRVPVTVDHIDGKWSNATENNLRILCPNCHSLTPTFQALNSGNGHPSRRASYLPIEKRQHERNGSAVAS